MTYWEVSVLTTIVKVRRGESWGFVLFLLGGGVPTFQLNHAPLKFNFYNYCQNWSPIMYFDNTNQNGIRQKSILTIIVKMQMSQTNESLATIVKTHPKSSSAQISLWQLLSKWVAPQYTLIIIIKVPSTQSSFWQLWSTRYYMVLCRKKLMELHWIVKLNYNLYGELSHATQHGTHQPLKW